MEEQDFPALYRSADKLSLDSQKHFFRILCKVAADLS